MTPLAPLDIALVAFGAVLLAISVVALVTSPRGDE